MFEYFNLLTINNTNVVDVWKQIDLSDILNTTDYNFHTLNANENLMSLSYTYYDTVDDWWCIYLFNELYDVDFGVLMPATITNTQNEYIYDIQHYTEITKARKQNIEYIIRQYYLLTNTLADAIVLTNNRLSSAANRTDSTFISEFQTYIYDELINNSTYRIKLKIPTQNVCNSIKNEMEKYRILWNN